MTALARSRLILASTSPYRGAVLKRHGFEFEQDAHHVDEDAIKASIPDPEELASTLALLKARSLTEKYPGAFILAGDQIVAFEGRMLGKPGSRERAIEILSEMVGKTHRLITSIALIHPNGSERCATVIHQMTMRHLDADELLSIIDWDEPYDSAGGYKIEGRGIFLFERIDGEDFTAIEGMPMMKLGELLRASGFILPSK